MCTKTVAKALIESYPFLQPRNVFTDKIPNDYDYTYIKGIGEIPKGWNQLFLQMCEDLRKQLIKDGNLEQFRFTQIKEKYNRLVCYHNGCSDAASRILLKYERLSKYVCTICGEPAEWETHGYIASFCDQHWKKFGRHEHTEKIVFKPYFRLIRYDNGEKRYIRIPILREWKKYLSYINSLEKIQIKIDI